MGDIKFPPYRTTKMKDSFVFVNTNSSQVIPNKKTKAVDRKVAAMQARFEARQAAKK